MRYLSKFFFIFVLFSLTQCVYAGWKKQPVNTFAWLRAVHFVSPDIGWVGGSKGTLLHTLNGGKTWTKKIKVTDDTIRDIYFLDKENGWMLLERNVYERGPNPPSYLMKTTDGGTKWEKIDFRTRQRRRVTSIFFSSGGTGMAVGETGAVFGLQNDNYNWRKFQSPSKYLMLDGAFTDDLKGTIVGGGGTILFTEDGGLSWNQAYTSAKSLSKLNSVFFYDKKTGWTVGSKGNILKSSNGGKFWRAQRSNTDNDLHDIAFINEREGWAVGENGAIVHTKTSGNEWSVENAKSEHQLEKIFFYGEKGWIVGFGGTILSYEPGSAPNRVRPTFRTR